MNLLQKLFFCAFILLFSCNEYFPDYPNFPKSKPPKETFISHQGIYINDFYNAGIHGNETKENELLDWCKKNKFNKIYLYNVRTILNQMEGEILNQFIKKSHSSKYRIDVSFVSNSDGDSFDSIISYHQNFANIPEGLISEIEFWNTGQNYDMDFEPWLNRIEDFENNINNDIIKRFYVGKIANYNEAPSLDIAKNLVENHDEIVVSNYQNNAFHFSTSEEPNSIRNKIRLLAEAGEALDKTVNVVILFNVNQNSSSPNIWDYFATSGNNNNFKDAFTTFKTDFDNATDIPYKEFINLKGYDIYRYSDAVEARP